jgi:ferredoxin-NADP reductase
MTVQSILADRERAVGKMSFLPQAENAGRRKIQDALDVIAGEIARLQRLQQADDRRRAARAETAEITALALRKAAAREAKRHLMITVPRQFFQEIGTLALRTQSGEAYTALEQELERIWALKE